MQTRIRIFLLIAAMLSCSVPAAFAHHAAPAAGNFAGLSPSAGPRKELIIRQVAPIEFGMLTSGAIGGNVTIDAKTGVRTVTGDVKALAGNYGRAEFEITGQPAEEVMLYFQPQVKVASKTGSVMLTKFTADPTGIVRLDQHGYARVGVGATLQAAAHSAGGQYNGFFAVDAHYVH